MMFRSLQKNLQDDLKDINSLQAERVDQLLTGVSKFREEGLSLWKELCDRLEELVREKNRQTPIAHPFLGPVGFKEISEMKDLFQTTSSVVDSLCVPNLDSLNRLLSDPAKKPAELNAGFQELNAQKTLSTNQLLACLKSANSLLGGKYLTLDRNVPAKKSTRSKFGDVSDDSDDEAAIDAPSKHSSIGLALLNKERLNNILVDMRSIREDPTSILLPPGGSIRLENHGVILQRTGMRQYGHQGVAPTPATTTLMACHRGEELLRHIMPCMTKVKVDCIDVRSV